MSLQGYPDWSAPLHPAGGGVYGAYREPRRALAFPVALSVAPAGNAPSFALELFGLDNVESGLETFALLTIRFVGQYDLAQRQQALFAEYPAVRMEPLAADGGYLRFEAPQAMELPETLLEPRPLAWAGIGALGFSARIDGSAASFLNQALIGGIALVEAIAEIQARGLAPRMAARATLNPALLAQALQRVAADGVYTHDALVGFLVDEASQHGVAFEAAADGPARHAAAQALADRLLARFAQLVPAQAPEAGATYAFDFERMHSGEMRWDLDDEILVPRSFVVRSNPLETARDALSQGAVLLRRAPITTFRTGLHILTLYPNLPPRCVGVLRLGLEIRVPALPPDRPQTLTASVAFRDGADAQQTSIRLAAHERVMFEYQATVILVERGMAQRLAGPWRQHEGTHLTISPDAFPVRFVRLQGDAALLALADVEVHCAGRRADTVWQAQADLNQSEPIVAVGVPMDVEDGSVEVVAVSKDGTRSLRLEPGPLEDLWLGVLSFPQAGPQSLEVVCEFDDGAAVAAIECVPADRVDDPQAVSLLRFTPELTRREWRWLVTDPFQAGYRYRWFSPLHESPAPWSEVLPAGPPLAFRSSEAGRVSAPAEGPDMQSKRFGNAVVFPSLQDPDLYLYAPLRPTIARDANGQPQLNLMAVGANGFLQLTGQWAVDAARIDTLHADLAQSLQRDAQELRLQPANDRVDAVELLLADDDGVFEVLQTGRSSGVPPFHAVFSAMLDEKGGDKARRALDGERGLLKLRYEITRTLEDANRESARFASTTHFARQSLDDEESESFENRTGLEFEESQRQSEKVIAESDAADWKTDS